MVSRRNMLKTGLTAVFGACAVPTASASEVQQKSQNNFDVVILGAGTGGLVTAIEAADLGLKPVVLEKMECSAGNSLYASGGIAAWGTSQQKEEGRNETKESFREDMMKVLKEADGDVSKLEKIFGMDEGDWGKNPVIIRVDDPQHLRIPDGNEMGAWTKYYIPGGFTSGNQAEAVIDSVPRGEYQVMKFNNPELMNWMKKGIGE